MRLALRYGCELCYLRVGFPIYTGLSRHEPARPEYANDDEREDAHTMKIEIVEAQSSTPERPLWVWRVWRDGRLTQGFSPSEKDAKSQASLAEHSSRSRKR